MNLHEKGSRVFRDSSLCSPPHELKFSALFEIYRTVILPMISAE